MNLNTSQLKLLECSQYLVRFRSSANDFVRTALFRLVSNQPRAFHNEMLFVACRAVVGHSSSRASSLEAFSCTPTHGSFSAMTYRSTEVTGHVIQRFLSYWVGLLSEWWLSVG